MTPLRFDELVSEALDAVPARSLTAAMDNVILDRRSTPVDFTRTVWPGDTTPSGTSQLIPAD
jgi:hypothetical protein